MTGLNFLEKEINVGKLTLRNRLVMPAMQTDKARMGRGTEEMYKYYGDRSKYSRPGLIVTGHCYIAENGKVDGQMSIASDAVIEDHYRIADAIHDGGSVALCQISHAGSKAIPHGDHSGDTALDGRVSASAVNTPTNMGDPEPRALTKDEIKEIQGLFAAAARRAMKAGYDGVEIHGAHAYLLNQFWSPLTNKRTDEYGGDVDGRLRFLLETIACVREAVGPDAIVAVRLGGCDYMEGGNTEEDAVAAAVAIEAVGADLIDVTGGMCRYIRQGHTEPGYFGSMSSKIKAAVKIPVIVAGGVRTLDDVEMLLEAGIADMIGVGRMLYKDAAWGKRVESK